MIFMVLPIWIKNWKFSFRSVGEMLLWIVSIVILLPVYGFLWTKKRSGGIGMLYGLAIVPVLLFLMNGISLRHYALVAASLLFMTIENSQSVFSIVWCMPFDDCLGESELSTPAEGVQRCSFLKWKNVIVSNTSD